MPYNADYGTFLANNLYCILTKFIHHICNQIETFLICKTGYNTDCEYFFINI